MQKSLLNYSPVAMSFVVIGEMMMVRELPNVVVQVMNNNVFFWVSTTTSRFEIVFNHPTGQAFFAKRALWVIVKVIFIAICIMAHRITPTNFGIEDIEGWFC